MVERALHNNAAVSAFASGADLQGTDQQMVRHIQPFRWPGGGVAAVEVRQTLRQVERAFARSLRESVISRIAMLALIVLFATLLTRWSIARPIRALTRAARAVGSGDLSQRIPVNRRDELGELAAEFNQMAERLHEARAALVAESEERLRLEQEAQQQQKLAAVGMLAAEVAHEIGTPLNVVAGRAEALERLLVPEDPGRRHLGVILSQTERIASIIRSLLDYTRARRPELRPTAIAPLIARVADLLLGRYRSKGVRIQLDLPGGLPMVLGDPDHLQQVFINLLTNALDASPAGAVVRVSAGGESRLPADGRAEVVRGGTDAATLAIHVLDQGPGLPAEALAHVFEPFFSTKRRGQGTGLGLPIVEEIIRSHRGEVAMLSVPGAGTEMVVRLPLVTSEHDGSGAGVAAPPAAEAARGTS
jgi:signal transduction histidine kinase